MRFSVIVGCLLCLCRIGFAAADDPPPVPAEAETKLKQGFQALDGDGGGDLSLDEALANVPEKRRKIAQRDFLMSDFDRDGKLSWSEYQAHQGFAVPDPWAELAAAALETWRGLLPEADQNKDEKLSKAEWPAAALPEKLRPLGEIDFPQWDADADGQVDLAEARRMTEIAYGIRHPDGTLMRFLNGDAVFWSYLQGMDSDRDEFVAEADFVAAHWMGAEKNAAYFRQIDADRDGRLSTAEFAAAPGLLTHVLDAFREFDADFDGKLSQLELARRSLPVQNHPRAMALGFAPFDDDGDGHFSLREFRLAPVGYLYVTLDLLHKLDGNHDGAVAWNEFHPAAAPLFRGVAWEVFRRYDRNRDGLLTVDEYDFPADGSPAALAGLFRVQDQDGSGGLSLAEFLSTVPNEQRKKAERDFRVMDFDRNAELSPEEYQAAKGGDVPDPWRKRADEAFQNIQGVLRQADKNEDGIVSLQEWPVSALSRVAQPFGEILFAKWDQNGDGQVADAEVRRMVDVAYGNCIPSGEPARWPNGSVLYWSHLKDIDKHGNYALTREQFVAGHWLGREKNEALFPTLDQDGDGRLSYAEISAPESPFRVNLVSSFFAFDRNLDGRLDHVELAQQCPPAQKNPRGLKLGLAAFDADNDGFDLNEFRTSPLGLLYVTVQLLHKQDTNLDGVISWSEFHPAADPQLAGIAWEVFRGYDRNRDGELTTEEYDFPEDPQLQQFVQQVSPQLRELMKAELRFFLAVCPLDDAQRQALKPAIAQMLNTVARRMAGTQRLGRANGDQQPIRANARGNLVQLGARINPNQQPPDSDTLGLFTQRLGQFAEQHLSADVAQAYRQEVESRLTRRRQGTTLVLVARLDRELLLSEDQRQAISQALESQWQPAWADQVEMLMQNPQVMLQLPDECLVPHLSKAQADVWGTIPKTTFSGEGRFFGRLVEVENAAPDELNDLLPPAADPAEARAAQAKANDARRAARAKALEAKQIIKKPVDKPAEKRVEPK